MKKIMMIAAMMVATLSANAQNEVGQWTLMPKIGINISSVTGDTNAGYDKKAKVGLVAGAEWLSTILQRVLPSREVFSLHLMYATRPVVMLITR